MGARAVWIFFALSLALEKDRQAVTYRGEDSQHLRELSPPVLV